MNPATATQYSPVPVTAVDSPEVEALVSTYTIISEWFLYPEEIDPATLTDEASREAIEAAQLIDPELAAHLREFRLGFDSVTTEGYLSLLELNPRCPLHLGSYQFEEPTTCSAAGVSDRNQYMLEMGNIFRHFGMQIGQELPDFLPAVTEFLALTVGAQGEDQELRSRFLERMVWPGVRLFSQKLALEDTPYHHLAEALTACLRHEAGNLPEPEPKAKAEGVKSELIQIEGVGNQ